MSDVILETRNLSKKYKGTVALDNVSVTLKKNHIYGFIGENGAGKSTFMKIISGLIFPTSGDYSLMGADEPKAIEAKRKMVGTMIEGPYLYPKYTVRQNVEIQRMLVGNPDKSATDKVIELVGLEEQQKKLLSQIIDEVNALYDKDYEPDFTTKAAMQIRDLLLKNEAIKERLEKSARSNSIDEFKFTYDDCVQDALVEGFDQNVDFYTLLLNNDEVRAKFASVFMAEVYRILRGE